MTKYKGRGLVMITGRNTGKSVLSSVAYQRLWKDIFEADSKVVELKLSEGTIYGSRYHTVEPVGGSWFEMEAWCFDTFGECGDKDKIWGEITVPQPSKRWYMNNRKFWFKEEKDRDWFVIKWNS